MNDLKPMIDALNLETLVPETLSIWRPLITSGLAFFLEHLPHHRLLHVTSDLLSLPDDTHPAERLVLLLTHCPTLHKLGQVIARHPSLDETLRHFLQTLESMPPMTPFQSVMDIIRAELPQDHTVEIIVDDAILAEGSVASIIPFTWKAGQNEPQQGVFKVLKPGIIEKLAEEFQILDVLGEHLAQCGQQLGLPRIDYQSTLDTVCHLMSSEMDLGSEQSNLRTAAAFYKDEKRIVIPTLLPWCTQRMTAMERIQGTKIASLRPDTIHGHALADTLVSTLLGQPFWSDADYAIIHADLHAGNIFITHDGRLAILDWSLTSTLSKENREVLIAIALGGLSLDALAMRRSLAILFGTDMDNAELSASVERALDRLITRGNIPGFNWLLELFDDLSMNSTTGLWKDFVLLRKSWLSLAGVIGDISAGYSPDAQLISLGLSNFFAELPARAIARPHARGFSTHVSNVALAKLFLAPWLIPFRYWERHMRHYSDPCAMA